MSMENLYKQFPDVHPNIVLKTDVLRQGVDISEAALQNFKNRLAPKSAYGLTLVIDQQLLNLRIWG